MPKIRILTAEDDAAIRRGLCDALESEGYAVVQAADGIEALKVIASGRVDLVLLDVMMPRKSGYDVCRELRRSGSTIPILMLTAKGEEIDKVVGLQLGADDYLAKPFGMHELLARVAAVWRRCRPAEERAAVVPGASALPDSYAFGDALVERRKYRVCRGRRTFRLSARELKLLDRFYAHPGEVLTRDDLLNAVWGMEYYGTTRTLDQHMAQLRKKIEKNPSAPRFLITVHGLGYRYDPGESG